MGTKTDRWRFATCFNNITTAVHSPIQPLIRGVILHCRKDNTITLRLRPGTVLTYNQKSLLEDLCHMHTGVLSTMSKLIVDGSFYNRNAIGNYDHPNRLRLTCDLLDVLTGGGLNLTEITMDLGGFLPLFATHSDAQHLARIIRCHMCGLTRFAFKGNLDGLSDLKDDSFDQAFEHLAHSWAGPSSSDEVRVLRIASGNLFEYTTTEAKASLFGSVAATNTTTLHVDCMTQVGMQSFVSAVTGPTVQRHGVSSKLVVNFNGNHSAIRRLLRLNCMFSDVTILDDGTHNPMSHYNHMQLWEAVAHGKIPSVSLLLTHHSYCPGGGVGSPPGLARLASDIATTNYQLTHFVGGRDSIGSHTRQILDVCTTLNRAKRIHLMPQGCDTNRNSVPTTAVVAVLTNLVEIPYVPAKVLTECLFTVLRQRPDVILAAVCLQLDGGASLLRQVPGPG